MPLTLLQTVVFRALLLAVAGSVPLPAQTGGRVPLTGASVAAALAGTGMQVDASEVELPDSLTAAAGEPQLHVTGAELLPDRRLRVRLVCGQPGTCQPFFATVRSASAAGDAAWLTGLPGATSPGAPRPPNPGGRLLAGGHATLLLEDGHMRITVPVLAIDTGAPGAEVRVSSLDRKQTYRAVVADAGTVRGTLP